MSSTAEFFSLLRLLDDETPQVREKVKDRLREYGGDVSEVLAECPHPLTDSEIGLLSDLLSGNHEIPASYDRVMSSSR